MGWGESRKGRMVLVGSSNSQISHSRCFDCNSVGLRIQYELEKAVWRTSTIQDWQLLGGIHSLYSSSCLEIQSINRNCSLTLALIHFYFLVHQYDPGIGWVTSNGWRIETATYSQWERKSNRDWLWRSRSSSSCRMSSSQEADRHWGLRIADGLNGDRTPPLEPDSSSNPEGSRARTDRFYHFHSFSNLEFEITLQPW